MNLTLVSASSPAWADSGHTTVNLIVIFEEIGGQLPFSANADDPEAHGRDIFARAIAGEFGPVGVYVPLPVVVPSVITMSQARRALLGAGLLAAVNAGISGMSEADQIEWEFAATVERASPLVATLASALSLDEAALDALFTQGAML